MKLLEKVPYFCWRFTRNVMCLFPFTRRLLFPPHKLATSFGPADAVYAWSVFNTHFAKLRANGFENAYRILEIGPGQNIGTSLLWWVEQTLNAARTDDVFVLLWDVYQNINVTPEMWQICAKNLISEASCNADHKSPRFLLLAEVEKGLVIPNIKYLVCSRAEFSRSPSAHGFELVYSQAALEHVWDIEKMWRVLSYVSKDGAWHSHHIDLADHGRRHTNYLEMLEWSKIGYSLTMRHIPGAINRWRACQHTEFLERLGHRIHAEIRLARPSLPGDKSTLNKPFRELSDDELKTTSVHVISRFNE